MILDEPFSGLDQQSIENLLEYLAATKKIKFILSWLMIIILINWQIK
ncbi:hypothetical protein RV18_GL002743 [Enterococcus termitis]|nr:hypothetical protein RV18_GL002743 [Enterococcus termitis]